MINGKYDIELAGQGFLVRKDSYNQQVDATFVNQIATDQLTFSDFSFWKVSEQGDFKGGYDHHKLDASDVFYQSSNIDIHYDRKEFRLSKHITDNLDTTPVMSDQINEIIDFNGKLYVLSGDTVFVSPDGTEGSYVPSQVLGSTGTSMTVYNNYLFAFMGSSGYWRFDGASWVQESDGTQAPAGSNEKISYATIFTIGTVDYIYAVYLNVLRRGLWNSGTTQIDWTNIKTIEEDVQSYLTKPIVFNLNLYFWSKRGSTTAGPSKFWIHDGTDTVEVYNYNLTIANRMFIYDNKLWFFLLGRDFSFIMFYDGTNFTESFRLDGELGGEVYDSFTYTDVTASPTGSGTYYDAGAVGYSDPVFWASIDERLIMTVRTNTATNYLYEFAAKFPGWSRRNDFQLAPNATYCLGVYNKELYIGDDIGEIFKIESIYSPTGNLETPSYDANVSMVNKLWAEVSLILDPMRSETNITVAYDLEESGSYITVNMPTIQGGQTEIIVPLSNTSTTVVGKKIRLKVTLTSINGLHTPVIHDVILKYSPMPDDLKRFQYTVLAINGLELYDGTVESNTALDLINFLRKEKETKEIKVFKDIDYKATTLNTGGPDLNETDTTFPVVSTTGFPSYGELQLEDERIRYEGLTATSFLNCERGIFGTIATNHADGTAIDNSWKVVLTGLTQINHLINHFDGEEALMEVRLYRA